MLEEAPSELVSKKFGKSSYITINTENKFISLFQVTDKFIMKITKTDSWSNILCKQTLPNEGKFHLTYKIINSACNNINIGIAPYDYQV